MKTSTVKRILSSFLAMWLCFGIITCFIPVNAVEITNGDISITAVLNADTPNCLTHIIGEDNKTTRVITWQTPKNITTGKVMYGINENALTNETAAQITHNATAGNSNTMRANLTGLTPGTKYYYKAGDGKDGHWSKTYSFTTESGKDFSFIQATDTQDSIKLSSTVFDSVDDMLKEKDSRYATWGKALSKIFASGSKYADASFLITTGDLIEVQNNIVEGENEYRWLLNNDDIKDVLGNNAYFPTMCRQHKGRKHCERQKISQSCGKRS